MKIQPFHCNKTIGHSQFQTLLNYLKKPNKDKSKFIQTNFENFHSSELVIGQWSAVGIFRKMYILIIYR